MLDKSYFLPEKRHFAVVSAIVPIGRGISHDFIKVLLSLFKGLPEIKLFNCESEDDCKIFPPHLAKAMGYFFSWKSLIYRAACHRYRPLGKSLRSSKVSYGVKTELAVTTG
ncbi:hypothetical protein IQ244_26850 [Nostoc sp. LEGE 06077]|nr:hypothetical protein [Nostoc sp. LEGE 06077]